MSSAGSITLWLTQLKAGEQGAAQKLWESYFDRLVRLASKKLRSLPRRAADEEDVVLSAFDSFCRRAEQGRFPQLADRDDLWQILVMLTARKAINLIRHEQRQKRRGGAVPGEPADIGLQQMIGPEPTPAFAAQMAEETERLLAKLGDAQLRSVAIWKMEGYSNDEIAAKLGCTARTVARKLAAIRTLWEEESAP